MSLPVETVPGSSGDSGRRTCLSSVLVGVEVSVPVSVKNALGQNACPNSRSGLDLNISENAIFFTLKGMNLLPGIGLGSLRNFCGLSLNPLCNLNTRPFLGLPGLSTNMAGDNSRAIR